MILTDHDDSPATLKLPVHRSTPVRTSSRPTFGQPEQDVPTSDRNWPAQVELVISALEAGRRPAGDRRSAARFRYREVAMLRLFSDTPGSAPWVLYSRDVNPRGMSFVTAHRLPLGYGGQIEIAAPDGSLTSVHCTLLRCREAAPGWFEGSVYFNREQPSFQLR